jgi:hypothetical protein
MFDQFKIQKVVFKIQMMNNPDATWEINAPATAQLGNQVNFYPKIGIFVIMMVVLVILLLLSKNVKVPSSLG